MSESAPQQIQVRDIGRLTWVREALTEELPYDDVIVTGHVTVIHENGYVIGSLSFDEFSGDWVADFTEYGQETL